MNLPKRPIPPPREWERRDPGYDRTPDDDGPLWMLWGEALAAALIIFLMVALASVVLR